MHVVDTVEEVILIVPAEGAEQHAKVQPGVADPFHHFIQHCKQRVWLLVEIVQIPCTNGCGRLPEACAIPAHTAKALHIDRRNILLLEGQ